MGGLDTKEPNKASCDMVAVCCVKADEKTSVEQSFSHKLTYSLSRRKHFDAG